MILEPPASLLELGLDVRHRDAQLVGRRHVVRSREHRELVFGAQDLARDRVELLDPLHLVAEELDAIHLLFVGRHKVDHVAANTKAKAREVVVVPLIKHLGQLAQENLAPDRLSFFYVQRFAHVVLDRADAVDAADAGDHEDIASRQQVLGRRVAHAVDIVVAARVFLDVGIGARDVGLGLVVVVIADEIFDGVARKQAPELCAQLGREGLVWAEHQHRPLQLLDGPGHDVGLAAAGDAEEDLLAETGLDPLDELSDGARLVAGRLEGCVDTKAIGHW